MEVQLYVMLWLTTLVFTIFSFIWPRRLYLPIFTFVLWQVLALLCSQLNYVGFGSMNVISQGYELGDPEVPASLSWILHAVGFAMLVYGIGVVWEDIRNSASKSWEHKPYDPLGGGMG